MDEFDDYVESYTQDGVLLKQAPSSYISFVNTIGTIYILESLQNDDSASRKQFLEWKPNDVTVDSDVQDQEWAVVNTVQKRVRTLSGNFPSDYQGRLKSFKISFDDIKSFHVGNKNRQLILYDGSSEPICSFIFQHGNCECLVNIFKTFLRVTPSRRDRHLYVVHSNNLELQQLHKSFATLNINSDPNPFWSMVKTFKENPYEVYNSADQREVDEFQREDLNRSLSEYEETSHSGGDYEVIQKVPDLPARKDFPRLRPLSEEQWKSQFNCEGRLEDVEPIKSLIFRGGVQPSIRKEVWKFLLDYFPWDSTESQRQKLVIQKSDEYFTMKLQWKSITKIQEENFSDYRERKSLIEKDVNRTDRTLEFYAGDNNSNLQTLNDILMTYIMYNFDLGYVQGMSDLLAPILMLLRNECDSFWCFVGFMNKVISNFDIDQAGMKEQLSNLHTLLCFADPQLANYLDTHDSGNMFFCFRWLLVWFKRELSQDDVMRFWEVLWTGYPCKNFHLLVGVAILQNERKALMSNNYGFTEILKHINELSGKLDIALMLNKAEGIFYQIKEAEHLTDNIRFILGLSLLGSNSVGSHEQSPFESPDLSTNSQPQCSVEHVSISPDEGTFEQSINSTFL
ncbi:TBC1 domain family member 15 isoform X2 [Cylas formicarius]|uniref:TBC1 domain family member 15 isoform X2 n=1 Tax=Cylas formicarius TaxID=197179 RepID=UPI0029585A9F|nr:TBC1 domain family member 15 isoform X2 [Cylas formicarius]